MNKISKKIVALVTMAAFVLTLVPFAAFAAPSQGVDVEASYLAVVNNKGEAQATRTVEVGEPVTAQFFVNDVNGNAVASNGWSSGLLEADTTKEVNIYATKGDFDAEKTSALVVNAMAFNRQNDGVNNDEAGASINPVVAPINANNEYSITTANGRICYGSQVQISFTRTGTYYLYATAGDNDVLLDGAQPTKIVVEEAAQVVDKVDLTAQDNVFPGNNVLVNNAVLQGRTDSTTVTLNNALLPNSIVEYTLTGVASECTNKVNGTIPAAPNWATLAGETFNLTSNSDNLVLSKDTVTTAPDGSFNISFSLKKAGDYRITLHNSDVNYTINVVYDSTNADIKTVTSNGETLLAGNDTENYVGANRPANYADAVEFEITDPDGGIVTGNNALANEPAANIGVTNGLNHADYLKVDSKPEGSKLAASDLILVANNDSYTLQYVGNDAARDLIPGEYTVTVSLLNGEYATAKMTFAKYGTTQSVVLDMTAVPIAGAGVGGEAVQQEDITDQVKLGRTVTVLARYVDENGVKILVQDATYGFDGKAVDNTAAPVVNRFDTRADEIFNESLFGTTITVTAFDSNKKEIASQELTVVDAYTENSLEFDKTTGAVDTNNNVTVSVVDANGKVVPVTGVLDAYVDAQSNADADVTVKVAKDMTNGADGKLILNSDKDTTADIVVSVKAGNAQYVGTLHYTFGDVAGAGTSVVMTIDSKSILVNNEMETLDVAPYVKDSRTYVPLRALAQSFGAEVNWDEKTGEITVDGNGTKVVLEVGKTTYTVNDNEKTMDVAPELDSAAGRTLVPVRFVAEALGYTVTAIYGADGTTSSVYFTM